MGCLCVKGNRVTDSDLEGDGPNVKVLDHPEQLVTFFNDFEHQKQKCVFVLGGSGSKKGEFMWDLVQRHEESGSDDMIISHISIDHLIAAHIKERIMDLVREGNHFLMGETSDEDHVTRSNLSPDTTSDTESVEHSDFRPESVKSFLQEFSNVVTSTWVFRLIHDEMRRQTKAFPDKRSIFLVNLIPNRINLFKRCIFLNQTPNPYEFPFDFVALNVVRGNLSQRKDLDLSLTESSFSDDVHMMLVKYFRSVGKLVEVVPRSESWDGKQLNVKVIDRHLDVNYKSVAGQSELTRHLRCHNFSQTLCINIHELHASETQPTSNLIFLLGNRIEVDSGTCLELDETVTDAAKIKTLIDCLRISRKIVDAERKGQLSPSPISSSISSLSSFRRQK